MCPCALAHSFIKYFHYWWVVTLSVSFHCRWVFTLSLCPNWRTYWVSICIVNVSSLAHEIIRLAASWQNQQSGCAPSKDSNQLSLGIRPVWSESSLCAQCVAKDPNFLHADSEDSDQTGRIPRLIWVFAGRPATLLVLSRGGSSIFTIDEF